MWIATSNTLITNAGLTTYSYNPNNPDELSTLTPPSGPVVSYGYDSQGNVTSISPAGGSATSLRYDPTGRLQAVRATNREAPCARSLEDG